MFAVTDGDKEVLCIKRQQSCLVMHIGFHGIIDDANSRVRLPAMWSWASAISLLSFQTVDLDSGCVLDDEAYWHASEPVPQPKPSRCVGQRVAIVGPQDSLYGLFPPYSKSCSMTKMQ